MQTHLSQPHGSIQVLHCRPCSKRRCPLISQRWVRCWGGAKLDSDRKEALRRFIKCCENGEGNTGEMDCDSPFDPLQSGDSAPLSGVESLAQPRKDPGSNRQGAGWTAQLGGSLLLISPFFFWGTSMVAMKGLTAHTTPLLVSAVRLLPAGVALLAWAALDQRPQPKTLKAWLWIVAFSVADGTCFQGFLAEGLQRTSAGLGSVIIDSQPLTVALLASLLLGEQLSIAGYAGLAVGVLGLCLLEVPPNLLASLPSIFTWLQAPDAVDLEVNTPLVADLAQAQWSIWDSGEWWMLLAAQSMAVGTVMVRYVSQYADPVVATGYHMLLGGLPLLALSLSQESSGLAERLPLLTGTDYVLLAYISLLGSAASYGVFFAAASRGNLTALSSLTFLTPCFAAGTGFLILGESLTPLQLVGATVTLGAVYLINAGPMKSES